MHDEYRIGGGHYVDACGGEFPLRQVDDGVSDSPRGNEHACTVFRDNAVITYSQRELGAPSIAVNLAESITALPTCRAVGGIANRPRFTSKIHSTDGRMINMIWHMMDCPKFVWVSAAVGGHIDPSSEKGLSIFNVEDFIIGLIHFDKGATIRIDTICSAYVTEHITRLAIMGTKGIAGLWPFNSYRLKDRKVASRDVPLADGVEIE